MPIDPNQLISDTENAKGVKLAEFIAATSVWASLETYQHVITYFPDGCLVPNTRRARWGDTLPDGVNFDSNQQASAAIRLLTGIPRSKSGFSACHIYEDSCYDTRYHTCVANLVLIPDSLESLTDHYPHVIECLKYRAWELYEWRIEGEIAWDASRSSPVLPDGYRLLQWRAPVPLSDRIRRNIERRARSLPH
ncbi:hypothetical protein [Geminisphaera colitermitum]|uniref:hypothetical protein n=1 Tax=Geminisphaera colitermitum TaxID=1148786 RepID=UPI000158CFDD|nr:hypothetical protein [Geminisphaera colitermitum]